MPVSKVNARRENCLAERRRVIVCVEKNSVSWPSTSPKPRSSKFPVEIASQTVQHAFHVREHAFDLEHVAACENVGRPVVAET